MKNYYKISEISKLYGIGPDSLRYYERLGILSPRRDKNHYRLYSLKDIYKLNLIRDLRSLNFSMAQIKEYLDHQTVNNTLSLLYQEKDLLKIQLQELQEKEIVINERIDSLLDSQKVTPGHITLKELPERLCVQEQAHITQDEEMDLLIKKLLTKHEQKIHNFGNQTIGAVLSVPHLTKGISNVYQSVFFILSKTEEEYDYKLPKGLYLSYYYRGSYGQNARCLEQLLNYAKEHDLTTVGEPFELFEIDNRDTMNEEEFLTEMQIRVKKDLDV